VSDTLHLLNSSHFICLPYLLRHGGTPMHCELGAVAQFRTRLLSTAYYVAIIYYRRADILKKRSHSIFYPGISQLDRICNRATSSAPRLALPNSRQVVCPFPVSIHHVMRILQLVEQRKDTSINVCAPSVPGIANATDTNLGELQIRRCCVQSQKFLR
jgi:hypothetical protein